MEGWKKISTLKTSNPVINLYSNNELVHITLISASKVQVNNTGQTQFVDNIPVGYRPYSNTVVPANHQSGGMIVVADNLLLFRHLNTSGTELYIGTSITYPKT